MYLNFKIIYYTLCDTVMAAHRSVYYSLPVFFLFNANELKNEIAIKNKKCR